MSADAVGAAGSRRSGFVTILSWALILLGSVATIGVVALDVKLGLAIHGARDTFKRLATSAGEPSRVPWAADTGFAVAGTIGLLLLAFSLLSLIAALGLRRRRNWARLTLVALTMFFALAGLLGVTRQFFASTPPSAGELPFDLGIVLVCSWVAFRLASEPVRAECGWKRSAT